MLSRTQMIRYIAVLIVTALMAGCGRNLTTGASTQNAPLPDQAPQGVFHVMGGHGTYANEPFKLTVVVRAFESNGKLGACGVAFVDGSARFVQAAPSLFQSYQSYIEFKTDAHTLRMRPHFLEVVQRPLSNENLPIQALGHLPTMHCAQSIDDWSPDITTAATHFMLKPEPQATTTYVYVPVRGHR